MTREEAIAFRKLVVAGCETLSDKDVSTAPDVLRRMKYDGKLIQNGTRINWNGAIKRAAVDLWDNEQSTPDAAPSLWEDVLYKNGIRIIPETITVGLAFSKGEQGWWDDKLYESIIDNNVWTPSAYRKDGNWLNNKKEHLKRCSFLALTIHIKHHTNP